MKIVNIECQHTISIQQVWQLYFINSPLQFDLQRVWSSLALNTPSQKDILTLSLSLFYYWHINVSCTWRDLKMTHSCDDESDWGQTITQYWWCVYDDTVRSQHKWYFWMFHLWQPTSWNLSQVKKSRKRSLSVCLSVQSIVSIQALDNNTQRRCGRMAEIIERLKFTICPILAWGCLAFSHPCCVTDTWRDSIRGKSRWRMPCSCSCIRCWIWNNENASKGLSESKLGLGWTWITNAWFGAVHAGVAWLHNKKWLVWKTRGNS